MLRFICVFALLDCGIATLGGSLKRRIERALENVEEAGDAPASSSSARGSNEPLRQSLRLRVERASPGSADPAPSGALVKSLMKRWAQGLISSPVVQEFASGAAQQGAEGLDRIAAPLWGA